jgi:hypothetical protein
MFCGIDFRSGKANMRFVLSDDIVRTALIRLRINNVRFIPPWSSVTVVHHGMPLGPVNRTKQRM